MYCLVKMVIFMEHFIKGLVLGFSIAAPVGQIGVLCIRRTLAEGNLSGFVSGLGAATADAVYGCIAGFGLTILTNFLVAQQRWLQLLGGLFLCYLGLRIFFSRPKSDTLTVSGQGLWQSYTTTFLLTLSNPTTILSFLAIFAGLGVVSGQGGWQAVQLVGGVFVGSAVWWLILSSIVGLLRTRFTPPMMQWVNRLSGVMIGGFGVVTLVGLL